MNEFRIGDIHVQRILEWEDLFLPIGRMLPDATGDALERHRAWLEPWALCPDTGRIVLPVQTYLVRTSRHTILLDTCIGNHKSNTFFEPWHDRSELTWLDRLAAAGVAPETVDYVLCTHLHLDHCGWHTRLIDGRWVPTFPNAKYVFAEAEFEHRQSVADSTFNENVVPVMEAGQGVLVAMDHALDDEVWLTPTPGHTPGHVSIHLASKGQSAVMMGDLMHSPVQCAEPGWHAVSDADPDRAKTTRRTFLDTHADTDTLVLTAHFPSPSVGHIVSQDGAFRFNFV
jgi:glyoxylase-like metal-dependent hydrolase (beta-lactamase superfamily II)